MRTFLLTLLLISFSVMAKEKTPPPPPVTPTPFVKPVAPKKEGVTDWDVLLGLDLKTGKIGDSLNKLLGKKVKLLGFMVPLDYDERSIKEFMLMPTPLSCTHLPPPGQNQIVLVKMKKGAKGNYFWGAVYTQGVLTAAKKDKNMSEAPSFEMVGETITEYKETDGSVPVHSN